MGRPLGEEDIKFVVDTFKDMEHLSYNKKICVFLPGIIFISWILYQYYNIITH